MESSGARLKKIRLEKGITLEEVHKKTNIHLNILKALEEDSLVGLSPVYIRGFLKIYCKFLGTDPKDYIAGYQEPQGAVIVKPEVLETPQKPLASFIRTATVKLNFFKVTSKKLKNIVPIFILIAIILAIGLFNLGKKTQKPKAKVTSVPPHSAAVASKKEVLPLEIRLGIRAKEDCWVYLKADGQNMFRAVLKKGKFETWKAKEKMELSLGNAGGVELELNSKPIPVLGRRGQVLKNILITKEQGLQVLR